jgi:hypothetical protein
MLKIQTGNLANEQRDRVHPDFVANEQAYLKMRDGLLPLYRGQWVAVHGDRVIAAGQGLMEVMDAAAKSGGHPYIACVGAEDTVVFRVRQVAFNYDKTYRPFALPRITATFWNHAETQSRQHADVIPDTGSDVSVLPDTD